LETLGESNRNGCIQLTTPVGGWLAEDACDWTFDKSSERLRHTKTGHIYLRQSGRPTRKSTMKFQRWTGSDPTFRDNYAASVIQHRDRDGVELEGLGCWVVHPQINVRNFRCFVNDNPKWAWWANELQYHEHEVHELMKEIEDGFGFAVSDGSYKDQHGTASMVLEGSTGSKRITTSVITPGSPDDQCAYRSEAAGILATIQMVNALAQYTGIKNGKCIMGCDGKSALVQCFY
jgi:hypothetical protein